MLHPTHARVVVEWAGHGQLCSAGLSLPPVALLADGVEHVEKGFACLCQEGIALTTGESR